MRKKHTVYEYLMLTVFKRDIIQHLTEVAQKTSMSNQSPLPLKNLEWFLWPEATPMRLSTDTSASSGYSFATSVYLTVSHLSPAVLSHTNKNNESPWS